jgi:hypothetical protein
LFAHLLLHPLEICSRNKRKTLNNLRWKLSDTNSCSMTNFKLLNVIRDFVNYLQHQS